MVATRKFKEMIQYDGDQAEYFRIMDQFINELPTIGVTAV